MEIIVPCDCGSRFCFEAEPVEEKLPSNAELLCPSCGKDGVPLANRVIGENLRKLAREKLLLQPPKEEKKSFFSRTKKPAEEPELPLTEPWPPPHAKDQIYTGPNKVRGMIGATIGGIAGTLTWWGVIHATGYEIRYVAVAVGALVGLCSRWFGGGRDYHLGLFASTWALIAILAGQYLATAEWLKNASTEFAALEFKMRLEQADAAVDLKTDAEMKAYIADSRSTLYEQVRPTQVSNKDLQEFKTTELPALIKLSNGDPTREAFIEQHRKEFLDKMTPREIFNQSISPYLFLWVAVGVGAAWKLSSDHGTSVDV